MVNGSSSTALPVPFGVSHGSVIGPVLFLIYTDEAQGLLYSKLYYYYADGMLLYRPISTRSDYHCLQVDVNKLSAWVHANHHTLSCFSSPENYF